MDKFKNYPTNIDSVCDNAYPIVPNDNDDLTSATRAIFIGETGDLKIELVNSTEPVVLKNVAAGSVLPMRIKKVFGTETTATNLIALL